MDKLKLGIKMGNIALSLRLGTLCSSFRITSDYQVPVENLKDAQQKWNVFCSEQESFREVIGGEVLENGKVIAVFSPNGRCWEPSSEGNEYYLRMISDVEINIEDE